MEDNVAIIGDWVPLSPMFSAVLGDETSSRTIIARDNTTEELLPGNTAGAQLIFSEQKSSSLVERMAARSGLNAPRLNTESIRSADLSLHSEHQSPYLTIPPGLSPTTLLDSPVVLSNSLVDNYEEQLKIALISNILNAIAPQAQPSPTTGKFSFIPNSNSKNFMLMSGPADKSKDNFFEYINATSFAFKTAPDSGSSFLLDAGKQSFPNIEVSVQSDNFLQSHGQSQDRNNSLQFPLDLSRSISEKDNSTRTENAVCGGGGHSPPLDEQQDEEGEQRGGGDLVGSGTPSEYGYNWTKYGQKQVKDSECPRSYYKCTHPNCPVNKKVECSHEGHITEIIYKGAHNHPKPPLNRLSSSNPLILDVPEQAATENDAVWTSQQKGNAADGNNIEVSSSASELGNPSSAVQAQNAGDAIHDEDEDDQVTHASVGSDGEGDESESKRRKIEKYPTDMAGATRAIREPRVVVQTTSEVDILDDGYRWRKYGQKVVKGNPNPRSYYKCTNAGCTVRKHVERASHDLKSVITTYEGKHNHDVPAARNSNSAPRASSSTQANAHVHRPQPSQPNDSITSFERSVAYGSFSQQLGPTPSFTFGKNQSGLEMSGFQPKMAAMSMSLHPYLTQQRQLSEIGFKLPKGKPKVEPMTEPALNLSNNPSVYQQIMNRLPFGLQM